MHLKRIFIGLALLIAAALGSRLVNADFVRGLFEGGAARPAPIRFDNGSVRQPPVRDPSAPTVLLHKVRKCVKGTEVAYTSDPCPAGMKEQPMGGGTMSVVAAEAPVTAPSAASAAAARARSTLRQALDPADQPNLQDRRIERMTQ